MHKIIQRYHLALVWLLIAGTVCWAQESRGKIIGRVTDTTGAVVPGASVRVTSLATGTTTPATTNEQGNYIAPFLLPAMYSLEVEKAGFKRVVRKDLEVRVDASLEVNVMLEVGPTAETVTVSAQSPLLETSTASLGQVVDSRRIADLPIPHGVAFHLMKLAPGATYAGVPWGVSNTTYDQPYAPSFVAAYTMGGTKSGRNEITMDGVTNTGNASDNDVTVAHVPPSDVVEEFKVETASFDASVGQTAGGVMNVSLKSGGNDPHGTLFYNKMDNALEATSFFTNKYSQKKGDYDYNRWGASATGPVFLPKIYNGRNKTFYMWGYQHIRSANPTPATLTVPTDKERKGDFSDLLKLGSEYQIYNPFTRRTAPGGRIASDPVPGNILPASLITPVATNILKYYSLPNTAGTANGTNNFVLPALTDQLSHYSHTMRIDQHLSEKHRIFGRGNFSKRDSNVNNVFDNLTSGQWQKFMDRGAVLDDVYTFSPTFVMNVRYGYGRYMTQNNPNPASLGFDPSTLGFSKKFADAVDPVNRMFPQVRFQNYQGTVNSGGKWWNTNDTHSFQLSFNQMRGNHQLHYGAEYRVYRENAYAVPAGSAGYFWFDCYFTHGPLDSNGCGPKGQDLASFLFGIPGWADISRNDSYAEQSTVSMFYLQDNWKLSRKLTVSLGLRYELESPLTERFNRSVRGFDYNAVLPISAGIEAKYAAAPIPETPASQFKIRGGLTFAGVNGQPRELWSRDTNNFMPKIGLAYSLNPKTVLRAGYGINYDALGQRRGDVNQIGFSQYTSSTITNDNGLSYIGTLANPYPDGILWARSLGTMTYVGNNGVRFFNPAPVTPYIQRWQFGIQRELPGRTVLQVSYIGSRANKLETVRDLKQISDTYFSRSPFRDQTQIDYMTRNVPNPFVDALNGTARGGQTIQRAALLAPYPHFGNLTTTSNNGYAWYHGMTVQWDKRFSNGFTTEVGYTFQKAMQATEYLNPSFDKRPVEVISEQDRPHKFSWSGIFELPFGRGKTWLGSAASVTEKLVGGWQLQGTYIYQSGAPIGFGNVLFTGNIKDIALPSDKRSADGWINVAGFERASWKQLDWNYRTFSPRLNGIRGDSINQWDMSAIKYFGLSEKTKLQFRAEFLNALNRTQLNLPDDRVTRGSFGMINSTTAFPRRIALGLKFVY